MKKSLFIFIFLVVIALLFSGCSRPKQQQLVSNPSQGTAIIITGAAARIPQEAALLEQLYNSGELNNVRFISGASSGALNAVMLNGILSRKITWHQYIGWLSEISNDSIFINKDKRLPVDTTPLRNYLTRIINDSLGYHQMKDLPIVTSISITELNRINIPKKITVCAVKK